MFCERCGTQLSDDARFCEVCGMPSSNKQQIESDQAYKDKLKKKALEEKWHKEESREKLIYISIGILVIALVMFAVSIGMKVFQNKIAKEQSAQKISDQMKEELEQGIATPDYENNKQQVSEEPKEDIETGGQVAPEAPGKLAHKVVPTPKPTPIPTPTPTPEVTVTQPPAEQTGSGDYIIADSATRYLTETDLTPLSAWELRIARNEIFARHGRVFTSSDLVEYFSKKSWYTPSVQEDNFNNSVLSDIERANLDLITNYESSHR